MAEVINLDQYRKNRSFIAFIDSARRLRNFNTLDEAAVKQGISREPYFSFAIKERLILARHLLELPPSTILYALDNFQTICAMFDQIEREVESESPIV